MEKKQKKLTHELVQALLADYADGWPVKLLCERYGVGRATVTWHVRHHGMLSPSKRNSRQKAHYSYIRFQANKHGLHIREIVRRYRQQRGRCAICATRVRLRNEGERGSLHLDHDHSTGQVRGFLCAACNTRLGRYERDRGWCKQADVYLAQNPQV